MSDRSKVQLRKELTQIRKAARVLRDPGTTSSWKNNNNNSKFSSSSSSRSPWNANSLPPRPNAIDNNDKKVFLYNWKNYKSLDVEEEEEEDQDEDGSSSLLGSFEGSYTKSHAGTRPSIYPRPSTPAPNKKSNKNRRNTPHFDFSTKTRKLPSNSNPLLHRHSSVPFFTRGDDHDDDDSADQSDDTQHYCNSEDVRPLSGASPLLMKLNSKLLRSRRSRRRRRRRSSSRSPKEDSSYSYSTPALSTSSYNRYAPHYPSTVGSWDATTTSLNDNDIDDPLDLPDGQGCGIPGYWSRRTQKHRGRMCGSCCSPSLSDTLRRKGSSIFCGSQSIYSRRRRRSSSVSRNRRIPLRGRGGSSLGTGGMSSDDDEDALSTNFGEIDLEGLSRLDGRRWSSSCRSQEGLEIVPLNDQGSPESATSFTSKYKPLFFGELIGQNIVVQSLINAVSRGRIAPVYLFQGPRGTGKTSTARIFAAALNCVASDESKPCGYCGECADFISGKSSDLVEVDGTNKKGIDKARYLLKRLSSVGSSSASSRYTVLVIDECHLLPSKTWLGLLKFLEQPPQRVVFIFITSDLDNVPRTIQSRCQKYLFNKIKDGDIVTRLRRISVQENLDVETDALDLIAMNADGSLRDAETMLEQLSLLGKRITTSLVNELVGVVSDEKLLELLELAMSSETAETVKRARELMDSGVDPMVLMSQLAGLIMDIIAGSYTVIDDKPDGSFFGGRSLNESKLERLKNALKLLSEAEKQLRTSSECSTWFTATLLQLGSVTSPDLTQSGSSRRQSCKTTEEDPSSASRDVTSFKHRSDLHYMPQKSTSPISQQKGLNSSSSHQKDMSSKIDGPSLKSKPSNCPVINDGSTVVSSDDLLVANTMFRCIDSGKLYDIWACCIEGCHSKTLRQLLHDHGKLVSICEVQGVLVAYVAFGDGDIKLRVERFQRSITNSMEMVLRRNVEVRIIHLPDGEGDNQVNLPGKKQAASAGATEEERRRGHMKGTESYSSLPPLLDGDLQAAMDSSDILAEGNGTRERKSDNPVQRIESIIREQRLETAWLQAVEKGSPGSLSRLRPEKNQVLPQDGVYCVDPTESLDSTRLTSRQNREDGPNSDLKVLSIRNGRVLQKDQIGKRGDRYPMSPSLLHNSSLATISGKDNLGYESGSGAGGCGFLCWNNSKTRRVKGTPVGGRKVGRFTLFGECGKPKKRECKR